MSKINRPTTGNYNELDTMRNTLSGKADSVFSYRNSNPYSVAYDKLKKENNANLDDTLWQQAANKGELDQYLNLLTQNPKQSAKLTELKETYGDRVDYDTAMLALSYDAITDDVKEDRYDNNGNLMGSFTQKELIDKVLEQEAMRWDAELVEEIKRSGNFWQKTGQFFKTAGIEIVSGGGDIIAGGVRAFDDTVDLAASGFMTLYDRATGRVTNDTQMARAFANYMQQSQQGMPAMPNQPQDPTKVLDDIEKWLSSTGYELRRKYSTSVDAVTGEYNGWGKIMHGMADSIGYMSLAMISHNPAAMYAPMFGRNVKENIQLSGPGTNYKKLVTNAGVKAGVEYGIEWGLGKIVGMSGLDKMLGFSDDVLKVSQRTVTQGLTATGKQAVAQVGLRLAKDMAKEGFEEVLQESSGMFIDYLYGDQYSQRAKDAFTLETFTQSFVIGAMTSLAIGTFQNTITTRAYGVNEAGLTYKMGKFQSISFKQATQTLAQWQRIAADPNANPQDRITAALKLEGTIATLGNVYESLGVDKAIKAEKLLHEVQAYHDRKAAIKQRVAKGTYITDMLTNLNNEVDGKAWADSVNVVANATTMVLHDTARVESQHKTAGKSVAYQSFADELKSITTINKLENAGTTKIETPIDLTDPTNIKENTIFDALSKLGFNVAVPIDGRDIIVTENVVFFPTDLDTTDIQALLTEAATQKTVMNILENMPAELLANVLEIFKNSTNNATAHYSEAELSTKATLALMFDKNFQLKVLLATKANSNTWGTDTVINFIKNLKKLVAKTYTTSDTEKTASGKPKKVLSDISKNIQERVVASLQESLVAFNLTVKRSAEYNTETNKVEVKAPLNEVLTIPQLTTLEQDANIRFSAMLDSLKADNFVVTKQTELFVDNLIEYGFNAPQLHDLINAIANVDNISKTTQAKVKAIIMNILQTGSKAARTDLVSNLTAGFVFTDLFAKDKLIYIALDTSNLADHPQAIKTKSLIEKTKLGNQSIASVLDGTADFSLIPTEVIETVDDFTTNEISRFYVIDNLFKRETANEYGILQDGTLIKISHDPNNLSKVILKSLKNNTLSTDLETLRDSKANKTLVLQDFFSIKLSKKIGQIPVKITKKANSGGYHIKNSVISISLGLLDSSALHLSVLLHEAIHAANSVAFTDSRYGEYGGDGKDLTRMLNKAAKQFTPAIKTELKEYLITNYPITSRLLNLDEVKGTQLDKALGTALYTLTYEENTARSVNSLYEFSALGFDFNIVGNKTYLVTPDGTKSWLIDEHTSEQKSEATILQKIQITLDGLVSNTASMPYIEQISNANSTDEIKNIIANWYQQAQFTAEYTLNNYNDIMQNIETNLIQSITKTWPTFNKPTFVLLMSNLKTKLQAVFSKTDLSDIKLHELETLVFQLNQIYDILSQKVLDGLVLINDPALSSADQITATEDIIASVLDNIETNLLEPLLNLKSVIDLQNDLGSTVPDTLSIPTSFNFGDYSFVNHTGRTYMLTHKPAGQSQYTTQEVDKDTLLPTRPNQKPILEDKAMRDRMLFVIARKIDVAKKKTDEPTLPEPTKKATKANKVVWEWGQWQVQEYDDTHYLINKNIDQSGNTGDETGDFNTYTSSQVVSKKTLLPETMLGATGKPILSASERRNLLDWIEHNTAPSMRKKKMDDGTVKKKFFPNLTDKSVIDVGNILRYGDNEYTVKELTDKGVVLENLDTKKLSTHLMFELAKAFDEGDLEALNQPTKKVVSDKFASPKPANRAYVSNAQAKKSNLKYFIKKGKPIQLHSDVVAFVEGTTDNFDKLSKFFKDKILKGSLTRHDIAEYVGTTKSINAYTWEALATFIYHNEALAKLGPNMAKFFLDKDRLEKFAIIARLTDDSDIMSKVNTMLEFKKLEIAFDNKIKTDPDFGKKYEKAFKAINAWWEYNAEGKLEKRDDFVLDEKQLLPIFMRHFDGTLTGLNNIFTVAKTLAGKQLITTLFENTSGNTSDDGKTTKISSSNAATENNTVGVKSKGSNVYRWLDNMRQNVIDYEAEQPAELADDNLALEQLTTEDKYEIVYEELYEAELADIRNPTEQDEYNVDLEVRQALANLTEAEIDNIVDFVLAKARKSIVPTKPTTDVDPNAPTRKTLKDGLRNKLRTLMRRLAGRKVNYNNLSDEVKALINFSVNSPTINTEAYTNMTNEQLSAVSDQVATEIEKLKVAQQKAAELEKTKATIIRKVQALQNKERALAEKEAKVKAREKALKEGKNLKSKIAVTYDTKVAKQTFTLTGPTIINPKLQAILNRVWDNTTTSKVKYMDDSVQTIQNIHNAEEFYKEHAAELSAMTLSEIEDITDWLTNAYINEPSNSVATQTFEATRFFILSYIYNETGAGHLFASMNSNLQTQLANFLKSEITTAGTLLSLTKQVRSKLNPIKVITTALFDRFEYELSEDDQNRLDDAISKGDTVEITKLIHRIKFEALQNIVPEKVPAMRKVAAIRSMSMISSPMTWLRNIISNITLSKLNPLSAKIGHAIFPKLTAKTENTTTQYKLDGKITPEIQAYITEQFIDSGFFDETIDQLSKYNPSQVLKHKKAGSTDILGDMIIHAIYNQFYSESMFNSKILNKSHEFLMKQLSDKKWVRAAAVKYLGKILAETNHHLDDNGKPKVGIDDDVMKDIAAAFGLSTADYMHSDNFFSHVERWLSQNSQAGWIGYKIIMPFATAGWNWFKAAVRYSPVGLAQSIVRLTKLEQEIMNRDAAWEKGQAQIAPELATYLVRRDLGSGVIGTIAFAFGTILAALGYISLEDDDWGTPKLRVGNLRIDISSIFGSSSVLAGAAFINTLQTKDLSEALDAMMEPLVDGFFFTDLLQMDANSPRGWFEWSTYQVQSIILSFIPSMVRYVSGATYTGRYRASSLFEKAVSRLPFMGQAFNVPKYTNVYTGDNDGTFWDIVHRLIPYFEVVTKSQAQESTEMYGLNKEELNGTYRINDVPFKVSSAERARINKLYGELNADALTDFYANKTAYRVLTESNRYYTKRYSTMTSTEINNALNQIFSANSEVAKVSAWLEAGHKYYTNDDDLFRTLKQLGYTNIFRGKQGFVE